MPMPLKEPPWVTGTQDLEPNDDNGQPKQKPAFLDACRQFNATFKDEPWFVRVVAPPDTENLFIAIVDASQWVGRYKSAPWQGYMVAVAQVPREMADKERKSMAEPKDGMSSDHVDAVEAFRAKYGSREWFLEAGPGASNSGISLISVGVDKRSWPGSKADHFTFKDVRYPVVICLIPGELVEAENEAMGEEF